MGGVPRWVVPASTLIYDMGDDPVVVVLGRDHDAAVRQAERDMLARAIAAVEASAAGMTAWDYDVEIALAALRALGGNDG